MRAGVFRAIRQIEVEDVPEPSPGPKDIVLRVDACGICGSDLHSFTHGSFIKPGQIMGHEFAGEVAEVGKEVEGIRVRDRVTALPLVACGQCPRCQEGNTHLCETGLAASIAYGLPGAFADYVRVPNAKLGESVFRLPDDLSPEEGALVEPLSVALHAVKIAGVRQGDTVVVIGLGTIGQGVVQVAKALGAAKVIGTDVSKLRLDTAAELGADSSIDANARDPLTAVREITGPGAYDVGARADVVFECSGVSKMLPQAIQMVRHGGKLAATALYDEPVPIDATMIVQKEMRFFGTFAYSSRDFAEAIDMICSGRVRTAPLITHRFSLDRVQEAFEAQLLRDQAVKVLVEPAR